MKVIILCESSGNVRRAFRDLGHDAWSLDILPADDGSPFHIQGDAAEFIRSGAWREYDLIGMHPPCKYLSVSGIHWNDRGRGWDGTKDALRFVRLLMSIDKPFYLENPVSIISSRIRKPDQIIQPYQFGEDASKATCLWLNGLPKLTPTEWVNPRIVRREGKPTTRRWSNQTDSGQNKFGPSPDRWKLRSRTYPGIAKAMAAQWSVALDQPSSFALT
jgi:hypothetical protein